MVTPYDQRFKSGMDDYLKATNSYPEARLAEFQCLKDFAKLNVPEKIIEFPAEGAFLESVFPLSSIYRADIVVPTQTNNSRFIKTDWGLHNLPTDYFDAHMAIAPIHHASHAEKKEFLDGSMRILRSGGILAFGEVESKSCISDFLDIFVDKYTPGGHQGDYPSASFLKDMEAAGFQNLNSQILPCPWTFQCIDDACTYVRELFKIQNVSQEEIVRALSSYIGIEYVDSNVVINWTLRFFCGQK